MIDLAQDPLEHTPIRELSCEDDVKLTEDIHGHMVEEDLSNLVLQNLNNNNMLPNDNQEETVIEIISESQEDDLEERWRDNFQTQKTVHVNGWTNGISESDESCWSRTKSHDEKETPWNRRHEDETWWRNSTSSNEPIKVDETCWRNSTSSNEPIKIDETCWRNSTSSNEPIKIDDHDFKTSRIRELEAELLQLRSEIDSKSESARMTHVSEIHDLKDRHNTKVETLLSKLSDSNLR